MKAKLLLLGLTLQYSMQIHGEPFTLSGLSILGILTKLGLVTTVGGATAATTAGTAAGIAAGTTAAGTAATAATLTAITAAASAGAAAGATAAAAAPVLTGKGLAVLAVACATAGVLGTNYWNKTFNNLPEANQKIITAIDNEQLKKALDEKGVEYKNLEAAFGTKVNKLEQIVENMHRVCNEFITIFKQHGLNIAALDEKQCAIYREMQMLRSAYASEKTRATA